MNMLWRPCSHFLLDGLERLPDKLQAPEIVLRPAGFLLDHTFQRFPRERAPAAVHDYGDSPPIGVVVDR